MPYYFAIGGEPASGKTLLMQAIIPHLGEGIPMRYKLIRGTKHPELKVILLGLYDVDNPFLGTDRLSMIAIRDGKEFATLLDDPTHPYHSWTVLFEGDRLFQGNFFEHLQSLPNSKFSMVILETSPEMLERRRSSRGELNQDAKFLKGRATKYKNLKSRFPFTSWENNTDNDIIRNSHDTIILIKALNLGNNSGASQ